ncbi:hypothetical protein [Nonomuraea sp. NPDC048826]
MSVIDLLTRLAELSAAVIALTMAVDEARRRRPRRRDRDSFPEEEQ